MLLGFDIRRGENPLPIIFGIFRAIRVWQLESWETQGGGMSVLAGKLRKLRDNAVDAVVSPDCFFLSDDRSAFSSPCHCPKEHPENLRYLGGVCSKGSLV
jgi:hypothetical protein